ncbi:hypothetical protein HanIR_Chr17g0887901 [Helianthus annuus]|nr:hypothetical protein HanIR_Chr17g0887901 [Helianthus annuus]
MCVCFQQSILSISRICSLLVSALCQLKPTHCMGIYTHTQQVWSKDPIDDPKDHLSNTKLSKDQQEPRKVIFRVP